MRRLISLGGCGHRSAVSQATSFYLICRRENSNELRLSKLFIPGGNFLTYLLSGVNFHISLSADVGTELVSESHLLVSAGGVITLVIIHYYRNQSWIHSMT